RAPRPDALPIWSRASCRRSPPGSPARTTAPTPCAAPGSSTHATPRRTPAARWPSPPERSAARQRVPAANGRRAGRPRSPRGRPALRAVGGGAQTAAGMRCRGSLARQRRHGVGGLLEPLLDRLGLLALVELVDHHVDRKS